MSRVSSVLFGSVAAVGLIASTGACTVSAQTKDRFTEANYVLTDTQAWNGESISINIDGVTYSQNGGVTVIADPQATTITANARLLAEANSDDKASADLTIGEVKNTFGISRATPGEIDIACGHGSTHGTSDGSLSGCELVEIHVPIGSATQKLNLKVLAGNGTLTLTLNQATIGTVGANNNNNASIIANLPDTLGGNISIVSAKAGDMQITLPTAFTADSVDIEADPGATNVGPFTDITALGGGATQVRGTAGTGLATLKISSVQFAGSSGKITLLGD